MKYCPSCKSDTINFDGIKRFLCPQCGWEFYQNTAAAVAGILEFNGEVLSVVRNQEPGKGMLDFPGGFVDPLETAEEALIREIKEELSIELSSLEYLCSFPNLYSYKGIEYSTCDIFFSARLPHKDFLIEKSEIADIRWNSIENLKPEDFSFGSMKKAIAFLKKKGHK